MRNCVDDCRICLKAFEDEGQPLDLEYRKQILFVCSKYLVSELGIEWATISPDEYLPFCAQCLENIEQISQYHEDAEKLQTEIKSCVQRFMIKSMRSRKRMKDQGVSLPPSLTGDTNSRVKIEPSEQQNCVACYDFYMNEVRNGQQTYETKLNILEHCKTYLYSDFIANSGGFDWNTLPYLEWLPFCLNCHLTIEKICDLGNNLKNIQTTSVDFVDDFLIEVFECRDNLKKKVAADGNSSNSNLCSPKLFSVISGKTTIVIGGSRGLPVNNQDCYIVSASSEENQYSSNNRQGSAQPHTINPNVVNCGETVSSSNQNTINSDITREIGGKLCEKITPESRKQSTENSVLSEGSVSKNRVYDDERMDIVDVSNMLPPETSIEELPQPSSHENVLNLQRTLEMSGAREKTRKVRRKKRFRYGKETSKIKVNGKCERCNRSFTYERNLLKHRESCLGFQGYTNNTAASELSFAEMPQLQVEYSNYPDVQMETVSVSLRCPQEDCKQIFKTKESLERHIVFHTSPRPHKCDNCGTAFVQLNHLKNHIRQKQCFRKASESTTSQWTFAAGRNKQDNEKRNTKKSEKRSYKFMCSYCNYNAKNSTVLVNHLQGHYDVALQSRCTACRKVFSNKYTLKGHMAKRHGGDNEYADIPFHQVMHILNESHGDQDVSDEHTEQAGSARLWVTSGFVQSE